MKKIEEQQFEINLINKDTDTSQFNCENEDLDNYFKKIVKQNIRDNTTVCYGVFESLNNKKPIAFYTLSTSNVQAGEFLSVSKGVSKHQPVPVILLGRLAVDKAFQSRGIGEMLIFDAMEKTHEIAQKIGCRALIVKAINEQANKFYKKYDFIDFPGENMLMIEIKTISRLIDGN